jgi:transposase
MVQLPPQSRIFVATQPVDCRKGINGLAAGCRQVLHAHPLRGAVVVFRHRSATALQRLWYDGQGDWFCTKRRSQGRCQGWPRTKGARVALSARARLVLLWHGLPYQAQMAHAWRTLPGGGDRVAWYVPGHQAPGAAQTSRRCSCTATRSSTPFTPVCLQVAMRLVSTLAREALGSVAKNSAFFR